MLQIAFEYMMVEYSNFATLAAHMIPVLTETDTPDRILLDPEVAVGSGTPFMWVSTAFCHPQKPEKAEALALSER